MLRGARRGREMDLVQPGANAGGRVRSPAHPAPRTWPPHCRQVIRPASTHPRCPCTRRHRMLLSRPASRPFAPLAQLTGRYAALRREPAAAQRWQHPAAATPPVPSAAPAQQEAAQPQATQQATQQPAQQQQAAMFLVRNETPVPCTMSSGAFLEASPRGAPPHPAASPAPACKCAPQLSTVLPAP